MNRLWSVVRRGVLPVLGLLLACLTLQSRALTLELRKANTVVTVQGQTTKTTVNLPYHWDRRQKGLSGVATFDVPFELSAVPTVPMSVYVSRMGNAYEVWLNGTLVQSKGDLQSFNGSDFAKVPRHIVVPPGLLGINNLFRIHIHADVGRRGGLAPMILGPEAEVYALYLRDYGLRVTGSLIVVIVSLLVGLLAMALWATQVDTRVSGWLRRDPLYLYAGIAELSWTVSVANAIIETPPLTWPWWGTLALVSSSVWIASMTLFCVEVANWSRLPATIWLRRWLALLIVLSVAAGVTALTYGHPLAMTLLYAAAGLTSLVFVSLFLWRAVRGASLLHKIVAVILLLNTLVGLRDLYSFRVSDVYGGNTYLRFSSVLFGLTLAYIVITRFRAASAQARDLTANLAARVTQKEQELAQTYQRMEQFAREQERAHERSRILRDMHDGVGSHISTAIRQLESGRASQGEVLHTLRDSLDQLKLSIDAMNLPPGDVSALLANLRYRLDPRLKVSDIELQWDVDLLPPLVWMDDKAMRHLQFMVFEAISNVLQHAQAKILCVELRSTELGGARLRVIDNGCGFELAAVTRRGLGSLRERATVIDASLCITSAPGKTIVEIVLT